VAREQQQLKRIGVLMHTAADDPEGQTRLARLLQGLQEAGWVVGRNVEIDTRWAAGDAASTTPSVAALQSQTRTVPIVFVAVDDPVGGGFVDSLARPGGNITGFAAIEFGMNAKWPELLKQIAPRVKRVGVVGFITVQDRTLTPLVERFIDCGRNVTRSDVGRASTRRRP
jgi:putative ABC transport system substrate-binding protein